MKIINSHPIDSAVMIGSAMLKAGAQRSYHVQAR